MQIAQMDPSLWADEGRGHDGTRSGPIATRRILVRDNQAQRLRSHLEDQRAGESQHFTIESDLHRVALAPIFVHDELLKGEGEDVRSVAERSERRAYPEAQEPE